MFIAWMNDISARSGYDARQLRRTTAHFSVARYRWSIRQYRKTPCSWTGDDDGEVAGRGDHAAE